MCNFKLIWSDIFLAYRQQASCSWFLSGHKVKYLCGCWALIWLSHVAVHTCSYASKRAKHKQRCVPNEAAPLQISAISQDRFYPNVCFVYPDAQSPRPMKVTARFDGALSPIDIFCKASPRKPIAVAQARPRIIFQGKGQLSTPCGQDRLAFSKRGGATCCSPLNLLILLV